MEPQPTKVVYPLNSRHISLAQLRQLTQVLGLPVTAFSADLQILVEKKLIRELKQDPKNVHLVVNETSDGLQSLELNFKMRMELLLKPQFKGLNPCRST